VVAFGLLLYWVPLSLASHFFWAVPGYLAVVSSLAGILALFAWALHRIHKVLRIPLYWALPLTWVGAEWLRAHLPGGFAFPWLGLGVSLSGLPDLLGMAEWLGERGVAFWMAMVNGLIATWILDARSRRRSNGSHTPRLPIAVVLLAVLIPGVGAIRNRTVWVEDGPSVAVVGTLVDRGFRRRPVAGSEEAIAQARLWLAEVPRGTVDLVILPEATAPLPLETPLGADARRSLTHLAAFVGAPVMVGALGVEEKEGRERALNSLFLVTPDGSIPYRYDKARLVPGMEGFPTLADRKDGILEGPFLPGSDLDPLTWGGYSFGPLICYESLFPEISFRHRRMGAQILVNITNDIWFSASTEGVSGWGHTQHAAHLVLRAIENRVGVVRSANGGTSFSLDPRGRVVGSVVPASGGVAVIGTKVSPVTSLFSVTGDLAGLLSFGVCLLGLAWPTLRVAPITGWASRSSGLN
jgi:apolipoprotein N-acyltransferase